MSRALLVGGSGRRTLRTLCAASTTRHISDGDRDLNGILQKRRASSALTSMASRGPANATLMMPSRTFWKYLALGVGTVGMGYISYVNYRWAITKYVLRSSIDLKSCLCVISVRARGIEMTSSSCSCHPCSRPASDTSEQDIFSELHIQDAYGLSLIGSL